MSRNNLVFYWATLSAIYPCCWLKGPLFLLCLSVCATVCLYNYHIFTAPEYGQIYVEDSKREEEKRAVITAVPLSLSFLSTSQKCKTCNSKADRIYIFINAYRHLWMYLCLKKYKYTGPLCSSLVGIYLTTEQYRRLFLVNHKNNVHFDQRWGFNLYGPSLQLGA